MRKEQCEKTKQLGKCVEIEFNKLKEFILETGSGVILVDKKMNETIFKKKYINNLFYLIDKDNLVDIKYIPHEMNMFLIAENKVKTINDEEYTIQLEKHHILY